MAENTLDQYRRRRDAAMRCEPLACGHRDPMDCDHDPPSEVQLDGAVAATVHLLSHNLPPIFDLPTIRALHRRHPRLAAMLARLRGAA